MGNGMSFLSNRSSSSSSASSSDASLSDNDINLLKKEYDEAQKDISSKKGQIADLESKKQRLLQDKANLDQLGEIDKQVKALQSEVSAIEAEEKRVKDFYAAKGVTLENLLAKQQNLAASIAKAKADKAKYDQWFNDIDTILDSLSHFTGQKIDSTAMVVKLLPKMEISNSKAALTACEKKSKETFDELLLKMEDINATDSHGMTLLMYSLKYGFVYGVERLLELGAEVNTVDTNGFSALMYACTMPHVKYIEKIIDAASAANLNLKTPKEGDTALHILFKNTGCGKIFYDEIDPIKQAGGDFSNGIIVSGTLIIDENADSVIEHSINGVSEIGGYTLDQFKSLIVCRKLKEKSADFSIINNEGLTPYFYLCRNQQKYLATSLESESIIDLNSLDDSGFQGALGKLFLRDYKNLKDFVDQHPKCLEESIAIGGNTLLHIAVHAKDIGLVQSLMDMGANQNIKNSDGGGITPLFLACATKQIDIVKYLLSKSPDLSVTDNNGFNALLWSLELRNKEITQDLINKGCNVDVRDNAGKTPLFSMVQYGWEDMVDFLISKGANPNITNKQGEFPLILCVTNNHMGMLNKFLSYSATNINLRTSDANQVTSLWIAAQDGKEEFVDALLAKGADPNIPRANNLEAPIHVALKSEHFNIFNKLINHPSVDSKALNIDEMSILHYSVNLHDQNLTSLAIKKGIDVNSVDRFGKTPLFCMVERGWEDMVDFLISQGADINILNSSGFHPLHTAVLSGNQNIISKLIDCGANQNIKGLNADGLTPLFLACATKQIDIVKYLLSKSPDLSVTDNNGFNALLWSLELRNKEITQDLINKGCNVDVRDNAGKTPLFWMAQYGWEDILDFLISQGADINILTSNGFHPMHAAVLRGNHNIISKLIDVGVSVDYKSESGITPLHYYLMAIPESKLDTVKFLISKGADPNVTNNAGSNPLHSAVHHCRLDIVKALLEHGANVNAHNNDKKIVTPLYYSMGYGNQPIVTEIFDYLLSHGADPNIAMFDGDTVMHMAGYRARYDLAKKLIEHGANINAVNHANQTPLYVCIKQDGYATNEEKMKTIKYFIAKGAQIETATDVSIFDLANEHLAEASGILQHPENVPTWQSLEVELFGDVSLV